MNVQQVKNDFENRVLISRATIAALILYADKCERALAERALTCAAVSPPDLPKYIHGVCEGWTNESIWNHACLTGWRAAQPAAPTEYLTAQEGWAPASENSAEALEVMQALIDMAAQRQASDATKRMNANIDAQMAAVDAARVAKRDRRVHSVPVQFDRRASAEDRRSAVRRLDLRRTEDK